MIFVSLALALVTGGLPPGLPASASVVGTKPLTAATTNSFAVTNLDSALSSNVFVGGVSASIYQLSGPSGYAVREYGGNFPAVATVSASGRVTPVAAGTMAARVQWVATDGTERGSTVTINSTTSSGTYSAGSFTGYLPGTLGAHSHGWITNQTNAGKTGVLWSGWSSSGWAWNTNSLLYSVTGVTGISFANSSGGIFSPVTAITRRHGYTCGHAAIASNAVVVFMGRDGSTNLATATARRVRYADATGEDYCLVIFSADLPAVVDSVSVAWETNITAKLPPSSSLTPYPVDRPRPTLETCQHGRVGSQEMAIFDSHTMHQAGDSGNPRFVVVSNSIVNYIGTSGTLLSTNFLNDLNALTTGAGLSTNDYQPTLYDLSAFPSY